MRRRARLALVAVALAYAAPAAAQDWVTRPGPEEPTSYVTGASFEVVRGWGDSFRMVAIGPGLNAFIGAMPPRVADELRFGVSLSSHGDDGSISRTELLSVYFEPYWAWPVADLWLRIAPRFIWAREFRKSVPIELSGFHFGAVASVRHAVGPRLALEAGLTVTNVVFDSPEVRDLGPDPDGVLLNWVVGLRAGVICRLR